MPAYTKPRLIAHRATGSLLLTLCDASGAEVASATAKSSDDAARDAILLIARYGRLQHGDMLTVRLADDAIGSPHDERN
jgi:hypothetical protein